MATSASEIHRLIAAKRQRVRERELAREERSNRGNGRSAFAYLRELLGSGASRDIAQFAKEFSLRGSHRFTFCPDILEGR
jgi:hypothetical protein